MLKFTSNECECFSFRLHYITFNSEIVLFFHCVSSICLVIWKHTVTPAFIEVAFFFFHLVEGADWSELLTGNMMILAGFKSLQAEFLQHTKACKLTNVAANVKCNQFAVWWVKTCRKSVVAVHCTCPEEAVGHQRMRRSYHCSGCMMPSLSRQTAPPLVFFECSATETLSGSRGLDHFLSSSFIKSTKTIPH